LEYNWVFFRFSIFGFMSANTLAMILSVGSILKCQMALIKFAISHITENLRFESTMLKFKVKIEKWFYLASSGAMPSIFLRIQLTAG